MSSYNSDNQTIASAFAYDGDGNPTTYKSNNLAFDAENRMTAFGSALTAGYTGDNLRAWKTNSSGTTYYLYDGSKPVVELNSSSAVAAANTFGANGLLSRHSGSSSTFYTFDPQGGTAQRLDSSAAVLTTGAIDAFGNRTISSSTSDPFSGYGSQWGYYFDIETGLELLSHRYYDPSLGRFLNRDPIGYVSGPNLYEYAGNNSVSSIDPTGYYSLPPGLECILAFIGCIAGARGCAICGEGAVACWIALIATCIIALKVCPDLPLPGPPNDCGVAECIPPTGPPYTGPTQVTGLLT